MKERLKRWFKLRFAILYPFGILALLFLNLTDASLRIGGPIIVLGLVVRLWANGYAIKMNKLTTSGPYAFVRNPLYFGTMLVATGFLLLLNTSYWGILFFVILVVVYSRTIRIEEKMLDQKFQGEYRAYMARVPALIPIPCPYRKGEKWPFSIARIIENKEYKLTIWIIVIVIFFYLKAQFLIERRTLDGGLLGVIAAAFVLAGIDITGEFLKWNDKRAGRSRR